MLLDVSAQSLKPVKLSAPGKRTQYCCVRLQVAWQAYSIKIGRWTMGSFSSLFFPLPIVSREFPRRSLRVAAPSPSPFFLCQGEGDVKFVVPASEAEVKPGRRFQPTSLCLLLAVLSSMPCFMGNWRRLKTVLNCLTVSTTVCWNFFGTCTAIRRI